MSTAKPTGTRSAGPKATNAKPTNSGDTAGGLRSGIRVLARHLTPPPRPSTSAGRIQNLLALLHELHREGTTLAVITHNPELAAGLPRRVEVRDGTIVRDEALR